MWYFSMLLDHESCLRGYHLSHKMPVFQETHFQAGRYRCLFIPQTHTLSRFILSDWNSAFQLRLPSRGICSVFGHFGCHNWSTFQWVGARVATKYSRMHRTAPHSKIVQLKCQKCQDDRPQCGPFSCFLIPQVKVLSLQGVFVFITQMVSPPNLQQCYVVFYGVYLILSQITHIYVHL